MTRWQFDDASLRHLYVEEAEHLEYTIDYPTADGFHAGVAYRCRLQERFGRPAPERLGLLEGEARFRAQLDHLFDVVGAALVRHAAWSPGDPFTRCY